MRWRLALGATCLAAAVSLTWAPARGSEREAREMLRVRIVNDAGGEIATSRDGGLTWEQAGRVLRYTTQVNRRGYTASKWAGVGTVAATAVNAIHVTVGYDWEQDRGVVFSVLPRDILEVGGSYTSFLSPDSSIYTDVPAGRGIFGGGCAPFVGNRVYREREGGLVRLEEGYVPARGDALMIVVERPARYPLAAVFENREGGEVRLRYADGAEEAVGWVIRPVRGVGRFLGALYAGMGRVRANHTGVIDVSTSPVGELGAFQIIPFGHALSPEMGSAWRLTQWMIVGPVRDGCSLWDRLTPLFSGHIRPDYLPEDLHGGEWRRRLLSRFLVEAQVEGRWRPMPGVRLSSDPSTPLPAWADEALAEMTEVRILFPLSDRGSAEAEAQGARGSGTGPL